MRTYLKHAVKGNKYFYGIYSRLRYSNYTNINRWVSQNISFVREQSLAPFIFYPDGAYVKFDDGVEFKYVEERVDGGLLGLEKQTGFEKHESAFLLTEVKEGDVVFDIGANFGFYSVLLSKKIKDTTVHAFEPVSSTVSILKNNIRHNRVEGKVRVNHLALSDSDGEIKVTNDRYAGNFIAKEVSKENTYESVKAILLDDYVKNNQIQRIDFIKCDVEGAELLVLRGGKTSLQKYKPKIFIEIFDGWTQRYNVSATDVVKFLLELGYFYKVITIDGQILASTTVEKDLEKGSNFYFY